MSPEDRAGRTRSREATQGTTTAPEASHAGTWVPPRANEERMDRVEAALAEVIEAIDLAVSEHPASSLRRREAVAARLAAATELLRESPS